MTEVISRADAMARGLKRYFTGEACYRAHVCEHLTSTGKCCKCSIEIQSKYRENNRLKISIAGKVYTQANQEKIRQRHILYRSKNKEALREKDAQRARRNRAKDPEASRAAYRKWRIANRRGAADSCRQWRQKNRERVKSRKLEYYYRRHLHYRQLHALAKFCRKKLGLTPRQLHPDYRRALQEVVALQISLRDLDMERDR